MSANRDIAGDHSATTPTGTASSSDWAEEPTNPALQLTAAELTEVTDALTSRYPKLPIVPRTIDAAMPTSGAYSWQPVTSWWSTARFTIDPDFGCTF